MKAYSVTVARPVKKGQDQWSTYRYALVVGEGFDDATRKVVAYYNDIDGVDDYFVNGVDVTASTDEGEGGILLI